MAQRRETQGDLTTEKKHPNSTTGTVPGAPMVQHGATDVSWTKDDLYMRLKDLKRQMEFSDIQEEYIKDDPWFGASKGHLVPGGRKGLAGMHIHNDLQFTIFSWS